MTLSLDYSKLYSTKDVAALFQVSEQSIKSWIKSGKLDALRVGRSYRITAEALESFLTTSNV